MSHIDHLHHPTPPCQPPTRSPRKPPDKRTQDTPRLMRETLQTRYEERYIKPLLNNNEPLNEKKYRKLLKEIHTNEVSDALLSYDKSPVLDQRAPKIAKDEQKLPRSTRRTLAQLRSG